MNVRMKQWVLGLVAVVAALFAGPAGSLAAVPGQLAVEGMLSANGGAPAADGTYDITFAVYNVQSGGSAAWTEGVAKVDVKNGRFAHVLGAKTPLTATTLSQLTAGWLGLKVGSDPELPRTPLRSVAYALLADSATKLSCSGCVTSAQVGAGAIAATHVGFAYAGSKTKGGPANQAVDLNCTGCVSVAEMKFDSDVNLGGNALSAGKVSAKDVVATMVTAGSYLGDGSKLTGIKIPSGACSKAGEVVKGINADGTLKCVAAMDPTALPADGIDEISNFLIHNQFVDKTCGKANIPIPDNNPVGVPDTLTFPDIGLSQQLDIDLVLTNSNLKDVTVLLYDPNNVEYTLIAKSASGKSLTASFPSKNKPIKGDLTTWVGKNPKGKWRIVVKDEGFLNNAKDGQITSWCVRIQTLSNKKIRVGGNLIVDGSATVGGNVDVAGVTTVKDLVVNGKISGAIAQYGAVFTYWGHKTCPTNTSKLYDGAGFSGHYSHAGANGGVCVKRGDPGPSYGYAGDTLYPMHTSGSMPPGVPSNKALYCAVCSWDKGQCFDMWGSDACPTGWTKVYSGYSIGPHYTHNGPAGSRYCINPSGFDGSKAGSGNGHLYGTRVESAHYGSEWPSGRALKCGLCCRGG